MARPSFSTAQRRARLVARHHLGRTAPSVDAAVSDLVALHSSDPVTPHLALWARVEGYESAHLDTRIGHGGIWRLHAMRRTLWVAPGEAVGVFNAATGAALAAKERKRMLKWATEARPDAEAWFTGLEEAALAVIAAQPGIGTRALSAAVPELATKVQVGSGKWTSKVGVGTRLLMIMAMELRVARSASLGSWRSSEYGWFIPGAVPELALVEAQRQLIGDYLGRFGPVTTIDIRWWTGLSAVAVKRALAGTDAVAVDLEGGEGWVLPGDAEPEVEPPEAVCLLPGLDPSPMGWKDRDWFLGPHGAELFDTNGNVGPTIWVGGRVVGGWSCTDEGAVVVRLLEDVGASAAAAVVGEAEALGAWLDGVAVTPRFRTPLEKGLRAVASG